MSLFAFGAYDPAVGYQNPKVELCIDVWNMVVEGFRFSTSLPICRMPSHMTLVSNRGRVVATVASHCPDYDDGAFSFPVTDGLLEDVEVTVELILN